MRAFAKRAGSSRGFTLLEVVVAVAILATSVAAIITIYIRATEQAAAARDLNVAASTGRNALEEAVAGLGDELMEGEIPGRPSLYLRYGPALVDLEEAPLADMHSVNVSAEGGSVITLTTKTALYIEEADMMDEEAGDDE